MQQFLTVGGFDCIMLIFLGPRVAHPSCESLFVLVTRSFSVAGAVGQRSLAWLQDMIQRDVQKNLEDFQYTMKDLPSCWVY